MKKILYILILALLIPFIGESQEGVLRLSLSEAIDMASQKPPDALIARHKFRQSYWEYRTFRAQYMPRLDLPSSTIELHNLVNMGYHLI